MGVKKMLDYQRMWILGLKILQKLLICTIYNLAMAHGWEEAYTENGKKYYIK